MLVVVELRLHFCSVILVSGFGLAKAFSARFG